jgi:hypothetical protein
MKEALAALDGIGLFMAGAHLAMAIDCLEKAVPDLVATSREAE